MISSKVMVLKVQLTVLDDFMSSSGKVSWFW